MISWGLGMVFIGGLASVPSDAEIDRCFEAFWSADEPEAADAAARRLIVTGVSFETIYGRLQSGRSYRSDVPRGRILKTRESHGLAHHYLILVPEDYDPKRKYLLRWNLHGGMGCPEWKECDGSWAQGWHVPRDHFVVLPAGWWDSMWWEASQVDNFSAILDEVKREYNVDENRVIFFGGSDGCVAAFFYSFRYPDPWSGYAGTVGFPARLTNPHLRADGQMHTSNVKDQRFFLRNAGKDRIVNIKVARKYMKLLEDAGADIDYREYPNSGHSLRLPKDDERALAQFLFQSVRDPLPDRITWSTERTDRYHRRSWLVIEKLSPAAKADRSNILPRIFGPNVPRVDPPRRKPWGRVSLLRKGNTVRVTTTGVERYRLLLSPEKFDFDAPLEIVTNGRTSYFGNMKPSAETLLRWAARDNDRTKLFAQELVIEIPPHSK